MRDSLHCLVHRIKDIRSCGLLRGQMGDGDRWGLADFLMRRRNVTLLPSEAHRNPPPLNSPPPLPSSPIPQPPSAVPPSPICGPLPVGNQPFSVDLAPERKEIQDMNVKRSRKPHGKKREREENKLTSNRSPSASSSG